MLAAASQTFARGSEAQGTGIQVALVYACFQELGKGTLRER
jgi:hypothetical protein